MLMHIIVLFSLGQCTSTAFAQGDLRDRHTAGTRPATNQTTHHHNHRPTKRSPARSKPDPASDRRASQHDQSQAAAEVRSTGVETEDIALASRRTEAGAFSEAGLELQHK